MCKEESDTAQTFEGWITQKLHSICTPCSTRRSEVVECELDMARVEIAEESTYLCVDYLEFAWTRLRVVRRTDECYQ